MKRLLHCLAIAAGVLFVALPLSQASAAQVISNGGFESRAVNWQRTGSSPYSFITSSRRHSGFYSAFLCGINNCNQKLSHTFTLPQNVSQAQLSFWVYVVTSENSGAPCNDRLTASIIRPPSSVLAGVPAVCNGDSNGVWTPQTLDVSSALAGQSGQLTLTFAATTNASLQTWFYIDDVQLNVTTGSGGSPPPSYTQISSDPFSNSAAGQHSTEVEPDTVAYGNTQVAAFQVGRIYNGGSTDIGWATSVGGVWQHGVLPGITQFTSPAGPYNAVSDASVAYDARHGVWLINSLALTNGGGNVVGAALLVNTSQDGLTWNKPVTVAVPKGGDFDKNWITCDNSSTSPYYGNCYIEWDNYGSGNTILMSTSSDGGQTWSAAQGPSGAPTGLGGQPLVQPNGTVIVPIANAYEGGLMAFKSTNGGASWSATSWISGIQMHNVGANLRTSPLPSAAMDSDGKVYVVWQDCRFESSCTANDIVMSTSTDGVNWSKVMRVAADPVGSGVDHFIPAIAIKPGTTGSQTQISVAYYYYPAASCGSSCQLNVGYVSSTDGGFLWSNVTQLAGPMSPSWLASTSQGVMVGDYMSMTYVQGAPVPVFAVATTSTSGLTEFMVASPLGSANSGHSLGVPLASRSGPTYNSGLFGDAARTINLR